MRSGSVVVLVQRFWFDFPIEEGLAFLGDAVKWVAGVIIRLHQTSGAKLFETFTGVTPVKPSITRYIPGSKFQLLGLSEKLEDGLISRFHPGHPPVHSAGRFSSEVILCLVHGQLPIFCGSQTTQLWARYKCVEPTSWLHGSKPGLTAHEMASEKSGPRAITPGRADSRERGTEAMNAYDSGGVKIPPRRHASISTAATSGVVA